MSIDQLFFFFTFEHHHNVPGTSSDMIRNLPAITSDNSFQYVLSPSVSLMLNASFISAV